VQPDTQPDTGSPRPAGLLDPRGPRFAAWVTTVVLVATLVLGFVAPLAAAVVALVQAVVFAIGAFAGPGSAPYGLAYRALVAPRLGRPDELEPVAPVRFAQAVGLVFTAVAAIGFFAGVPVLGVVATALALVAAFLNAAFGLCLGCEVYLAYRRLTHRPLAARVRPAPR
jgi:MFS family permease